MKVDLQLDAPLRDVGHQAAAYRSAGVAGGFTYEGRSDPFLPLAVAGAAVDGFDLYTNVAVGPPRNAMVLAYQAWDLQRLTDGRFALGLGSQVRAHVVRRYGAPWERPVAQMRELIEAVRAIHRRWQDGTPLEFDGAWRHHSLMPPTFDPGALASGLPPILAAAVGPKMTTMAAETADGIATHPFTTERYFAGHTVPLVEAGLAATGRNREQFRVVAGCIVAVGSDDAERETAERACRALLGFYGSTPAYLPVLEAHGWADLHTELRARTRAGRWSELGDLWEDEMLDALTVRGTPREVGRELTRRFGSAADRVALSIPYPVAAEVIAELVEAAERA